MAPLTGAARTKAQLKAIWRADRQAFAATAVLMAAVAVLAGGAAGIFMTIVSIITCLAPDGTPRGLCWAGPAAHARVAFRCRCVRRLRDPSFLSWTVIQTRSRPLLT